MKKYHLATAAVLATFAATLTACGGDDTAAAADGELEKTELTVGVLPLADYATVYWAEENGLFEDEGLDVTLEPLQGGPVGVQKVAAGELDFSFSNSVSAAIAQSKGVPVQTVIQSSSLGPDSMGVFVEPDSDIQDIEDLDGRSIGTNTTKNIGDVTFANLASSEGIDTAPEWIEVPFPEVVTGVQSGSIDAGYVPEPFKSAAEEAGLRQVVDLSGGPNAEFPASTFIASDSFVDSNPDTVAAFAAAMFAANAEIRENEQAFREWLPDVAGVDQATADTMSIPVFTETTDVDMLQTVADMLIEQGLVSEDYSAADHTYVPEG
jgi:NitT/TauT family transport system substrate-binding protein